MTGTTKAEGFGLGDEIVGGEFHRQDSRFRGWVGDGGRPPEAGRYHLYVSLACPWSHRAVIARRLKGLEDAISISYLHPYRDERGWAFAGGPFVDDVNGFAYLKEAYDATVDHHEGRVTVPVLWDKREREVVNNESADIMRMFDAWTQEGGDLYPRELRAEIDAVNARVYDTLNNGVYRAGFASSQAAYDAAYRALFDTLDGLEARLSARRYLAGERITEADWRLFVTLVRFDAVYHTHFRLNGARIVDYPSLWGHTRELYQWPGIAETVRMDEIKRHYYTTHDELNPSRIIPAGPERLDFTAPHGRG